MKKVICKNNYWDYLIISFSLLFISLLACGMSIYYLKCNPDHLMVFDDSYITLKFAANFFKYKGITYDGTSFLVGATSPFHIICVALCSLFLKLETASLVVGIFFFTLSSLLVYLWTLSIYEEKKIALLAGLLMSTSGLLVFDALNGLETTTFIFFSLLTFYLFYMYNHRVFYVFPLFFSILTRPEGWFILCSLWVWQIIHYVSKKDTQILRNLLISSSIFFLLSVPYMLLSLYCTASLLPSTAFSKTIFFAEINLPLVKKVFRFGNGFIFFYKTLLFPTSLFMFTLCVFARRLISISYLWFYCGIFYLFYFMLFPVAIVHYWCRYQHIFIPLIIIAIAGGVFEFLRMCKGGTLRVSLAALIVASLVYNQCENIMDVNSKYSSSISCTRNTSIDLALWLRSNTPQDSLIAVHDIGVVGYFSERNILDLVGLVNPEVSSYYLNELSGRLFRLDERRVIDYLKEKKPDYLVMFPEWDGYFNLLRSTNKKYFKLIHTTPTLYPTEMQYNVFKCNWEL